VRPNGAKIRGIISRVAVVAPILVVGIPMIDLVSATNIRLILVDMFGGTPNLRGRAI